MATFATNQDLTYKKIFRFWLPLAATWLMMAVEGPFLAAVIARMGETKLNLAAYGVAYAFALVAESPVIMLMSAGTALVRDRLSYRRLRNFTLVLCAGVTALLGALLVPPVYRSVAEGLIGLSPEVADLTYGALLWLLPWPAAIGLRRFYQGVLIAGHCTRRVAAATVIRVMAMAVTAMSLFHWTELDGALVGGLALSCGVTAEALVTRLLAGGAIAEVLGRLEDSAGKVMGYREIGRYYLPLALTPFIGLSIHPMVTFFLGKSPFAVESLAVMPVLYALTFVFRALGISFQEVAIALVGEQLEHYRKVRNFAVLLGGSLSAVLLLMAWTPLSSFWFHTVSGLAPDLASFADVPLKILAVLPALTVFISFQRSILVVEKATAPVSWATAIEAFGIFSLLSICAVYSALPGVTAAAWAYIIGRVLAIVYLGGPLARTVKVRHPCRVGDL